MLSFPLFPAGPPDGVALTSVVLQLLSVVFVGFVAVMLYRRFVAVVLYRRFVADR